MPNPLMDLGTVGQSAWIDFLDRPFLTDGSLGNLIQNEGISGVTSNPSIFEKAVGHGQAYDLQIRSLIARDPHASASQICEALAVEDIRMAADILHPTYHRTCARDGYVSLEVAPALAHDTEATILEARRLWRRLDRPNVMIKVPGTEEGIAAIRELARDGINTNVTLLFSRERYAAAADAFAAGLEARIADGEEIRCVAAVASFFVSRIDSAIDKEIDRRAVAAASGSGNLAQFRGKLAIANAKLAYQTYLELIAGGRWLRLQSQGALPQRLLWASTGTKDPTYPDTLYVDSLIGRETVTTLPTATMEAFRDHGTVRESLTTGVGEATMLLAEARRLGLDLDGLATALEREGIEAFAMAASATLRAVAERRNALGGMRR